jgi:formate--tetrahydrofolate ligase
MLSDIEIINASKMLEIEKITEKYGIEKAELFNYGKYIAKVEFDLIKRTENNNDGKLILVTAITPTPAGEGKSTTTIGLVDGLNLIGEKTIGCIREPSLGPVFGVKGGAAGGGYAQVNPMVDLNLHFTGDLHAITTANNLVAAVIDNVLYHGNELNIDSKRITWKRCMDLNDRALRKVEVGLDSEKETPRTETFNITVASEIMAILCLSAGYEDLRIRLNKTIVAYDKLNNPITIEDLKITGSLMVLLKNALKPNIIQTLENNLMFAHGGPFANIAHGCNSIVSTKLALKLADFVVTEAGFGADLGAEKFLDIKCQEANLNPNLVVIVATIRALKYHGGVNLKELKAENLDALKTGVKNLERHLETVRKYQLPAVVAINKFESDSIDEVNFLLEWGKKNQVEIVLSEVFSKGGAGGVALAEAVVRNVSDGKYSPLYKKDEPTFKKIEKICHEIYQATGIEYSEEAKDKLDKLSESPEYKDYYICMAKTPNSITDNPKLLNVPKNHTIHIKEVRLATGSKFIICLTGSIMTMPGLSKVPMATNIDMDDEGNATGIM